MTSRAIRYFSKSKALKILEKPLHVDLFTLLNASFVLSGNSIVKNHMKSALHKLGTQTYKLTV